MNTPDGFIFLDTFENVNILNIWTRVTQYLTLDTLWVKMYLFPSTFVYLWIGLAWYSRPRFSIYLQFAYQRQTRSGNCFIAFVQLVSRNIKGCQKTHSKKMWICQISDRPISFGVYYRTIEFPTSLWIKYPIPWCWNTFLGDNNFGAGKKGTSSQIDGTLGLGKDTWLFSIFCFKRKLARKKICYRASYWISETKREAQNYWRKIFIYAAALVYLLFLCNIFLAVVKVSCSGQSNNGRTMGSWHTALFAKLTQNHQTFSIAPFSSTTVPLLIISQIHCLSE